MFSNEEFSKLQDQVKDLQSKLGTSDTLRVQSDIPGSNQKSRIPTPVFELLDDATIQCNARLGHLFRVTLGGDRTLANPSNLRDGQKIIFEVIQDGTGNRLLSFDTLFAFGTDIPSITLSTTASKRDFIGCIFNVNTNKLYVVAFSGGY